MNKFLPALVIIGVIALLAWKTITDEKVLYAVWIILGFFVVRIVLIEQRKRVEPNEQGKAGRE